MTILDFVRLTRHNLRLLLGCIAVGLLAAGLYTLTQPVVYAATSSGVVVAGSAGSVADLTTGQTVAASRAITYPPLIQTQAVAKRIDTLMEGRAPAGVAGRLSATVLGTTPIIRVTATGSTPAEAQELADVALKALADEIIRLETINDPLVEKQNEAAKEAAKTAGQGGSPPVIQTPTGSVIRMEPYESAVAPGSPISPNWRMNLLVGALAGLAIGYVIALILKGIDGRIRSINEIETLTSAGVLGVIPETPELAEQRQGGSLALQGAASEAMRQLRTNLRFVNVDHRPRAFVVTSANPGEGKSTVAANLAAVLAEAGTPTVLVDADLRRPAQHKTFGIDSSVGLTQFLAGDIALADAVQRTDADNLFYLPAGRTPPNPSELVGSHRMAELIKTLARDHLVIIDAPPLLPVTDAGLLTAAADGAILVIRVNKTYKEQVRLSARILDQVNGTLLGSVLNRAPKRGLGAVIYGYGYGYGSYQSSYYYTYAADGTRTRRAASSKPRKGSKGRSGAGRRAK